MIWTSLLDTVLTQLWELSTNFLPAIVMHLSSGLELNRLNKGSLVTCKASMPCLEFNAEEAALLDSRR